MAGGIFGGGGLLGGGGITDALQAGVPEGTKDDAGDSYRLPMGVADFDSFGATLQSAGETVELARYEVPAGLKRRWGYGRADAEANQGYLYGYLANADDEQIHGKVTYKWENSTGRRSEVNDEAKTQDMDTANRYDREQQRPYPEDTSKKAATQDEYLVVEFTPETAAADITNAYAIDAAASDVRFPTTEYDVA